MLRNLFTLVLLVVMASTAIAEETHPFSVHDMLAMDRISQVEVSPDGKQLVFVKRTTDLEANRGRTDLWLINADGEGLRRLTAHEAGDFNPLWSADGEMIYFLSTRSESSQIWKISIHGGEAQPVSDLPLDVSNLKLSPCGKLFAFSLMVFVEAGGIDETVQMLEEIEKRPYTGRIYEKLFFRHWDTWKDGRRSHLFVMPVDGGDPVDVSAGMDADIPTIPWGGSEEFNFTPDGKGIAFTAKLADGSEEVWSTNYDLWVAPLDASSTPQCLTTGNKAWDTTPVFSPDGKTVAYLAMSRPGYEADRYRILLSPFSAKESGGKVVWTLGEARELAPDWDHTAYSLSWSANGKTIYTHAPHIGERPLFALDVKKGSVKQLVEKGAVRAEAEAGNRIVFVMDSLMGPAEIYSMKTDGKDVKRVTRINDEKLALARRGETEHFSFKGAGDDDVWCYVVKPVDFDESKKYPVAFLIHGGPQGSFGNSFHYRWNPQAYTGAGYAAVMVDFHGSTGYGQDFCDAIRGDWGGKPLEDLQKGLAAALDKYKWMDGEKVSALGASYGGYMINWISGNWPDRFKCLINHDGNLDERMAYFDTEELWFPEWDHMGTPWGNPEGYEHHNPVNFVQNWKTPMLVIHGALDYRVVETQGMSTFTVLQRLGIPSKFLYFPDENHWVLQPQNSILWHDTVIGWLDQWTK